MPSTSLHRRLDRLERRPGAAVPVIVERVDPGDPWTAPTPTSLATEGTTRLRFPRKYPDADAWECAHTPKPETEEENHA